MTDHSKTHTLLWRAPDLGAELLLGRFTDFSYDVHTHDTACFALLTGGAIRIKMKGRDFVAQRGDLYAIAAHEPHAGWPVDAHGWKQRTLYVDLDYLRALVHEPGGTGVALGDPIIRDPALFSLLYGVHRCSELDGPAALREEHYLAFAARLFALHTPGGAPPPAPGREARAVQLAREFLEHRLAEHTPLATIAEAAGLPVYRLFRAFSRAMGMTPHGFQRQARIRLAADLIKLGRPLSEVAAAAGFADQAHLTRCFRRALGVTPGSYRAAMRA
jgi:AraC-like DNA-binding protein